MRRGSHINAFLIRHTYNEFDWLEFCDLENCNWKLKLYKRACEANAAEENSSLIFTVCVKSVPLYHFRLVHVVLHKAMKEIFETHF